MKRKYLVLAVACILSAGMATFGIAQEAGKPSKPEKKEMQDHSGHDHSGHDHAGHGHEEPNAPDMEQMQEMTNEQMLEMMQEMVPQDVRDYMARAEGSFRGEGWMVMDPSNPARTEYNSTETHTRFGNWLLGEGETDFGSMTGKSRSQSGWDMSSGEIITTWIDDQTPSLFLMKGKLESPDRLVQTMIFHDPTTGTDYPHTMVTEWSGNDNFNVKMSMTMPDGSAIELMEIDYKRTK